MTVTTQAINLRRRYLCKRSRTDVIYFEPLDSKPIAVTQLPFSMNRWIPYLRSTTVFLEAIFVFSSNDDSFFCYHTRFVFVDTFKKAVTNPTTKFCSRDKAMFGTRKFLRNWQRECFFMKFFPNQSFWSVCKPF